VVSGIIINILAKKREDKNFQGCQRRIVEGRIGRLTVCVSVLHCVQIGNEKWDRRQRRVRGGAAQGARSLFGEPKREQRRGLTNATSRRAFKDCPSSDTTCNSTQDAPTGTTGTSGCNPEVETQVHSPWVSAARAEQVNGAAGPTTGAKIIDNAACTFNIDCTEGTTAGAESLDGAACAFGASEEAHGHQCTDKESGAHETISTNGGAQRRPTNGPNGQINDG
jgi:hypothetical protein